MTGQKLGPYQVLAKLGEGGMGEVYKARDMRLDRTVAIKVLPADVAADPERRARFEREARAIAALSHPHICTASLARVDRGSRVLSDDRGSRPQAVAGATDGCGAGAICRHAAGGRDVHGRRSRRRQCSEPEIGRAHV